MRLLRRSIATVVLAIAAATGGIVPVGAAPDTVAPPVNPAPAARPTAEALQVLQAWVTHEMQQKASSWPQRAVTIDSDAIVVPYGPQDPPDYKAWMHTVVDRWGFEVTTRYVADAKGVPTMDALQAVKADLIAAVSQLPLEQRTRLTIGINPEVGAVAVNYEETADPKLLDILQNKKSQFGNLIALDLVADVGGNLSRTIGGFGISSPGSPQNNGCTIGFNMIKNGAYHFITASHCVAEAGRASVFTYWGLWDGSNPANPPYDPSTYLGYVSGSLLSPPLGDMAAIKYSDMAASIPKYGAVYQGGLGDQDITGIVFPSRGLAVCAFGISTWTIDGTRKCGTIIDPDTYTPGGTQEMIWTTIGMRPGDSGGPLWRYDGAVGILCCGGQSATSYFTPAYKALTIWGLDFY